MVGNTLLKPEEVNGTVQPFAGSGRDFGDVQRALDALEALYQARGYNIVTVQLPEQELNGGVVRLNVVQSRIGKIHVHGQAHFSEANVRRSLPSLQEGQTPNLKTVSANLKLANDNPARKITLKLQSGSEDELVDPELSSNGLLFRLFHEDGVRVFGSKPLRAFCRCSQERIETVLKSGQPILVQVTKDPMRSKGARLSALVSIATLAA